MASSPGTSPEDLLKLAKLHFSNHPSASIPDAYLKELKTHLQVYPRDTNFRVTLQPKVAYGTVHCLERDCNRLPISLKPRAKDRDGGKKDGFGSLSAYREHIADHPTHAQSRLARVEAETARTGGASHVRSSSTHASSRSKTGSTSLLAVLDGRTLPSDAGAARPGSTVKTEPVELTLPRKRNSEVAFSGAAPIKRESVPESLQRSNTLEKEQLPPALRTPSAKRVKMEVPRTPLGPAPANAVSSTEYSHLPASELRARIQNLDASIATKCATERALRAKRHKTASDMVAIQRIQGEIRGLETQKKLYEQSLPVSHAPTQAVLRPSQPAPIAQAKREPESRGFVYRDSVIPSAPPAPFIPPPTFLQMQKSTSAEPGVAQTLQIPPTLANGPVAPCGSLNGISLPQPVASGSNIRLPSRLLNASGMKSDDDSDVEMGDQSDVLRRLGLDTRIDADDERFDDQGNFHGKGRDLYQGPRATADDIDEFLKLAGAEQFDGNATVDDALQTLGLPAMFVPLKGMTISLLAHQLIGVSWMLKKEQGTLKGGCLADEMGLGKTVQMMALMVANRSTNPRNKTTLIVAPLALMQQWELEIETKTNCGFKCLIYHGSGKTKAKTKAEMRKYDVVLTTFSTMALEWPDREAELKQKKPKKRKDDFIEDSDYGSDDDRPKRSKKKKAGPLFETEFYRIVLDEAQNIRNRRTRASRAASELIATYRWCLTGTPIINSLLDAYGMLRFVKMRPWYDFDRFHPHISRIEKKNPGLASSRLQAINAHFLLRRKKDTMMDGKRLIELPPKEVALVKLEFSEEERAIYTMVEARSQATFNRFLRAGTVLKNYHQVLVLLLRLRQICSHASLIQEGEGLAYVDPADEGHNKTDRAILASARKLVGREFVNNLKAKLLRCALQRMEDEKQSTDAAVEGEECPICFDNYTDPTVTSCSHTFCKECIDNIFNGPHHEGDENDGHKYGLNQRPCPSCRSPIQPDKVFARKAFEPTAEDLAGDDTAMDVDDSEDDDFPAPSTFFARTTRGKGKGKAPAVRKKRAVVSDEESGSEYDDQDDDLSDFIVEDDEDEEYKDRRKTEKKRLGKARAIVVSDDDLDDFAEEDHDVVFGRKAKPKVDELSVDGIVKMLPSFLPSTKMKAMMESLTTWADTHPDEKTIVVSQWTSCLSLVSDYLNEKGIVHVKYQGDMTREQRDRAVRKFMTDDSIRVMCLSLKCGGCGLTLTAANRVISLDLAWSEAVEAQAFDRVHRLGQQKDVLVQRLVIENTVEDRILALQQRKQNLADGSLGEGTGKKLGRLSVKELANLLGLDARGRVL